MGSYPGPACYSLGGDQPTLTDAFVTAGLINPDYFLGGTKPIDRELARKAIEESVARPLRISTEEACKAVIDRAFEIVAGMIANAQAELQQDLSKHTLFAYGGNGGLFACSVAEKAGLSSAQIFALGPVFSAFGSSVSDISHVYERAVPEPAISEGVVARIREMLEEMKAESVQDLLGEGIRPENVSYAIEFEVAGKGRHSVPVACSESALALRQGIGSRPAEQRSAEGRDLARSFPSARQEGDVEAEAERAAFAGGRFVPRADWQAAGPLGEQQRGRAGVPLGIAAAGESRRRLRNPRGREHHVLHPRWLGDGS